MDARPPLRIVAVVVMRNEERLAARCLEHLISQGLSVHVVDNESVDRSAEIARGYLGRGVLAVETLRYPGYADFHAIFTRIEQLNGELDADWIVRCDADEIMEAPAPFTSLAEGIAAADGAGYTVVDFDEFVFPPTAEHPEPAGDDYVAERRHYYFFRKGKHRLQRAWKRRLEGVSLLWSGGHRLERHADVFPTAFVMRHYIALGRRHALSKYAGRVYSTEEFSESGWHGTRVPFRPAHLDLPSEADLKEIGPLGVWDRSDPWDEHSLFGSPRRTHAERRLAPIPERPAAAPPAPFIVGAGRSGTTLLRMMLDAHPDLAVPPETHVVPRLLRLAPGDGCDAFLDELARSPMWRDFHVERAELAAALADLEPFDVAEAVRVFYRAYAAKFGKGRWGDKTPRYVLHMTEIGRMLPEARFVHLIRDGRDVAVSSRDLWFGAGADITDQAGDWVWRIREARQQAQRLRHYVEVRYEDLVRSPAETLGRICAFLDLGFDERMLEYHATAAARLEEYGDRLDPDGGVVAEASRRRRIHERVTTPVDGSRIGRWRSELTAREVTDFEEVAGVTLKELGY